MCVYEWDVPFMFGREFEELRESEFAVTVEAAGNGS